MAQNAWWEMWMAFIGSSSKESDSVQSQLITSYLFTEKNRSHQTGKSFTH